METELFYVVVRAHTALSLVQKSEDERSAGCVIENDRAWNRIVAVLTDSAVVAALGNRCFQETFPQTHSRDIRLSQRCRVVSLIHYLLLRATLFDLVQT